MKQSLQAFYLTMIARLGLSPARAQTDQQSQAITQPLTSVERARLINALKPLERQGILYFLENRHPNGLILDRAPNPRQGEPTVKGHSPAQKRMASIAATGYGFTAWILAVEKGMLPRQQAKQWTLDGLNFVDQHTPEIQRGWLGHFLDAETGDLYPGSEVSSVDTVLFYLGAIAAAEYFGGKVKTRVEQMLDKVDFQMMLTNDGTQPNKLKFSHGFHIKQEENGQPYRQFIANDWDTYSEGIIIPLLALGLKSQNIHETVWTQGWDRSNRWRYGDTETFQALPLFTYFYPHGFFNFKGLVDSQGTDFWAGSQKAVKMQMDYCRNQGYPDGLFGITACDGPKHYHAYHPGHQEKIGPSEQKGAESQLHDQTIAPPAILACLPFAERPVYEALKKLEQADLTNYRYGLCNAYEPQLNWRTPDALGVDIGSMLLMTDAWQQGRIHRLMQQSPIIQQAMKRAGFHKP